MFLRSTRRKKDGKDHRYFSIVESHRLSSGKMAQRTVLYLGEVNDQQAAAWRKSLQVFDEDRQSSLTLSLFPEDREIPQDAVDGLQVKLSGLELRRARVFGNCWLACELASAEPGWFLATTIARRTRSRKLGEGVAVAGGESVDRSGQRVAAASAMVSEQRDGRIAGSRFCGGGERPALPLSGSDLGAQAGAVRVVEAEVGGFVSCRLRGAAVRFDEHVFRRRDGREPQGQTRLQPRWPAGLYAGRDCTGHHPGWFPVGLRSHGWQYFRSHHPARISRPDRKHLRPGETDVGDGSRHPQRSHPG